MNADLTPKNNADSSVNAGGGHRPAKIEQLPTNLDGEKIQIGNIFQFSPEKIQKMRNSIGQVRLLYHSEHRIQPILLAAKEELEARNLYRAFQFIADAKEVALFEYNITLGSSFADVIESAPSVRKDFSLAEREGLKGISKIDEWTNADAYFETSRIAAELLKSIAELLDEPNMVARDSERRHKDEYRRVFPIKDKVLEVIRAYEADVDHVLKDWDRGDDLDFREIYNLARLTLAGNRFDLPIEEALSRLSKVIGEIASHTALGIVGYKQGAETLMNFAGLQRSYINYFYGEIL